MRQTVESLWGAEALLGRGREDGAEEEVICAVTLGGLPGREGMAGGADQERAVEGLTLLRGGDQLPGLGDRKTFFAEVDAVGTLCDGDVQPVIDQNAHGAGGMGRLIRGDAERLAGEVGQFGGAEIFFADLHQVDRCR